ncbi:MAG: sigma-70 family RNA polymerase sigma factor [Bacteroidales bacterium]|nr:sigma-70 family RNA polymerase sigma factor [Bacteroidales bacterium]
MKFGNGNDREIVADVFFYLWLNRKKLPGLINIDGYLYSAVKNQSLKYLKKNKLVIHSQIDQFSYDFFIENNTPESILLSDELKTIYDAAVKSLPHRCREIFILVKEEGLKYKEVAEKLSISHRTVQAQVIIATKNILLFIKQKYQSGLLPKLDM